MNFRIIHLFAAFASTVALVGANDLSPGQVIAVASEFIGLEEVAQDSGACNLVAQGILLAPLSTADVALQIQGGCRASIEEGDFTVEDVNTLLPFPDTLVNVVMTGEQIKNVLEDGIAAYLRSTGSYPRASGLRFDVNEARPRDNRITNLEVNARLAGSWEAIDMSANYTVATSDHIADGGNGYFEFSNIADALKFNTSLAYNRAFIDYAMAVETLEPVPADRASTQMWSNELLPNAVVAVASEFIGLEEVAQDSGSCDLVAQGILLAPYSSYAVIPGQVVIQNQGGCRASIEEGDFTVEDANALLPFPDFVIVLRMTGEQIKNVLEEAMQFYLDPNGSTGAYPRASGLRFNVNEARPMGNRVSNLEINPFLAGSWEVINMTTTYRVATNSYLALGNDGYNEFGNIPDDFLSRSNTSLEYNQTFIDYAIIAQTLEPVPTYQSSTQMWSNEPPSDAVLAVASEFIGLEEVAQDSGSCDLVAQGFLLAPGSIAMVALQNQGGCRASIEEGDFTVEDANALLPFPSALVIIVLTGEQIKNVLEDAIQFYLNPDGSAGAYPRASGLRFDVNEAQPMGNRISNLEVNNRLAGSWVAIDMSNDYQLVTNDYLADGNDGYNEFGNISDNLKLKTNMTSDQTFIDYAISVETLEPVPADRASTQMWSNELPPGTVVAVASEFIGLEEVAQDSGSCDLVAQAFLLSPGSIDMLFGVFPVIALQNQGGCRASIEKGDFTVEDANALLPFNDTLVAMFINGEQIKNVLEDAIQFYLDPDGSTGAYPRASGLRFDVNEAQPMGNRVSNLEVYNEVAGSWEAIVTFLLYELVTNDYLANGNDGYNEFGNLPPFTIIRNLNMAAAKTFIDYAFSAETLEPVPADQASTQMWSDELPPDTIVAVASEFIGLEEVAQDSGSCDLVAQGFLLAPGSIVPMAALQNQGGCRASIEEGNFTVEDANALLPFPDTLVIIVLTGEQIKNVLEDAIQFYLDPDGSAGAYPRASGLRFDVNEAQPMGNRVSNLEFNNGLAGSWEAIDMSNDYHLVTNNYLANGNDGYNEFGNISDNLKLDMNMTSNGKFIDYAISVQTLEPVPADRASTQMWSDELPPDAVVAVASEFIGLEEVAQDSGSCDLVAQGFLLAPGSIVPMAALQNQGGCRASIGEGNFTVEDANALLPFNDTLVIIVLTGEQIKNVLEDAMQFYLDPDGSTGAYPRASGLRFDVNEAQPMGNRVSNLEFNNGLAGSWEAIDMSDDYHLVTNDYLANGNDGYNEFGNISDNLKLDMNMTSNEKFIDYAMSVETLEPVPADRTSTQMWSNELPETEGPETEGPETEDNMVFDIIANMVTLMVDMVEVLPQMLNIVTDIVAASVRTVSRLLG